MTHRRRLFSMALHVAVLVALALAPIYLAPPALRTLGRILVVALLAASLDLLAGTAGLPSLGHAAYFAAGGYTAGLVAKDLTTLGPAQVGAAVLAGVALAALTGWVVLRTSGVYFLVATLAVGQIAAAVAAGWDDVTGGSNGLFAIPPVEAAPGGRPLTGRADVYWYTLAGFGLGYGVLALVNASPFGQALRGTRDNPLRMATIGYSTFRLRYGALCTAGGVAGAAGALLAAQARIVTPNDAGFETSVLALLAVIVGGAGSLWGACAGAALVVLVRDRLGPQLGGHGPLLLGLVLVAVVYLLPRGLAGVRLARRR